MARLFNGTSDVLSTIGAKFSQYSILTLSVWLWWDAFANNDKLLAEHNNNGAGGFQIDPNSAGTSAFAVMMDGGGAWFDTFTRPSAAAWHHYLIQMDRTTPINAVWVDSTAQTLTTVSHVAPQARFVDGTLTIMGRTASLFGAGRMADLTFYGNTRMTGLEAAQLYKGRHPLTLWPDKVVYYMPMDAPGLGEKVRTRFRALAPLGLTISGTGGIVGPQVLPPYPTSRQAPDIQQALAFMTNLPGGTIIPPAAGQLSYGAFRHGQSRRQLLDAAG